MSAAHRGLSLAVVHGLEQRSRAEVASRRRVELARSTKS
jgi:hypothetical protein